MLDELLDWLELLSELVELLDELLDELFTELLELLEELDDGELLDEELNATELDELLELVEMPADDVEDALLWEIDDSEAELTLDDEKLLPELSETDWDELDSSSVST